MKIVNQFIRFRLLAILFLTLVIVGCEDDDVAAPGPVEETEVITDVTLIFTPTGGGTAVMASAQDPDGEGGQGLQVLDEITLSVDTEYTLTYVIENGLDPDDVEDIAEEIEEEDDEHQFFYSFSTVAFFSPPGNGNIDNASDPVNYVDRDENDLPVGLVTNWTTPTETLSGGTFRTRLQHQPPVNGNVIKTATSGSQDGDTDFDLTFVLNIQ